MSVSRQEVEANAIRFARHDFSLGVEVATEMPRRTNCIIVIGDEETEARWFGTVLGTDDVAVSRGAIDLVTAGVASFYSMTFDGRLADQFTRTGADAHLHHNKVLAAQVRRYVRTMLRQAGSGIGLDCTIDATLAPMLALLFEEPCKEQPRAVTRRIAAVRLCEEYVRRNIDDNPTLYDLSRISGLRLRSLINAFQAVRGMSPMAYLKRQRLNGVRQALLAADASQTRIVDVAANWGFWHMGHFASDYRAMFGESPSRTLHLYEEVPDQLRERDRAHLAGMVS